MSWETEFPLCKVRFDHSAAMKLHSHLRDKGKSFLFSFVLDPTKREKKDPSDKNFQRFIIQSGVNGSVLSTAQNRKRALGSIQQQDHQQNQQRSKCSKFWVMKTNNAIGPYEIFEALLEFRFTFLHFNTFIFLDLAKVSDCSKNCSLE